MHSLTKNFLERSVRLSIFMRKITATLLVAVFILSTLAPTLNAQSLDTSSIKVTSDLVQDKTLELGVDDTQIPATINLKNAVNQNDNSRIRAIENEVVSEFSRNRNKLQKHVNGMSSDAQPEENEPKGLISKIRDIVIVPIGIFKNQNVEDGKVRFVSDNILRKPEDVELWRQFHRQRVDYLQNQTDLPPVALEKARHGRDEFENLLLEKGYILHKFGEVKQFEESRIKTMSSWFKKVFGFIMPKEVYAYLFGSEDFESCSTPPCSFDTSGSWGSVTSSLDSTSKVSGADSLKEVVTGEGGGGLISEGYNTDEIYVQYKVFIPSTMAWGTSGYNSILRFVDPSNSSVFWLTIEDWGTARLTMMGDTLSWTNTGLDLTKGAVNTIEVRFKKGASTGDVDIWLNNTTEGSPNYNGSGTLNTGTDNVDDINVGVTYSPDAISTTYYDDIIINDSFIGAGTPVNNAPTAPASLLVEGQTNPTGLTDITPEFSAIFNDVDTGEVATHYQIQVATTSNFASTYWDTGSTTLASSTPKDSRIADISYSGSALASSTTYYWRIKFWDDEGAEGSWSTTTSTFIIGSSGGSATTSYYIYDDALHAGWSDYSWSIDTNLSNGSPVYEGSYSAEATYTSAWGGFSYHYGSIDTVPFDSLDMAVNVGSNTSVDLYLYFATTSAIEVVPIEYYVPGGFSANTWHQVSIPLYDLDFEDFSGAATFNIESSQAVTVYYDDIKFVGVSSSTNTAPTAPTSLQTEGQTNPSNLVDSTPEFSAIYNDVDAGDTAEYYQIQVDNDSDFGSVVWNSTKTALSSSTSEGERSEDISYSGSALASSTTYYWRIKFWDESDVEGSWSSSATFSLLGSSPEPLVIYDEAMASGWNNWSYGGTFTEDSTEQVSSGTYSIKAIYAGSYGALYPRNGNLTTAIYDNVEFDMYIDSGSGLSMVLGAFDDGNATNLGYVAIEDYLPGNVFTFDEWNTVTIPLADINADNLTNEDIGFYFESANAATVFFDNIQLTTTSTTSTNTAPTAPTSLQTEGQTNPSDITDILPEFSAIYNDGNEEDIANNYRMQVADNSSFTSPVWDSGKTSMPSAVAGYRTNEISYSGSTLSTSTTYYWRIKFWDAADVEGLWSTEAATFSIDDYEIPENNLPADLRLNNVSNDPAQKLLLKLVNSLTASGSIPSSDPIGDTASLATFLGNTAHASSSAYASTTAYLGSAEGTDLRHELNRLRGLLSVSTSTWNSVKSDIFALQNSDGGFGYVSTAPSDVETTLTALDLFAEVGDISASTTFAITYVLDQIDSNGRIWYPNGEEASYYLMNRALHALRFYDIYNITVGTTTYDISNEADLVLGRLVSELDTDTFYLSGSSDVTESLMAYSSFKESGDSFEWLQSMREVLVSRMKGNTYGNVYTDTIALRALATSEMGVEATAQTGSPANGESYVVGITVENTGLSTPSVLTAHMYIGDYLVGSVDLSSNKPLPGQTKNYNLTVSSSGARKFLDVMDVRVFLETKDLFKSVIRLKKLAPA